MRVGVAGVGIVGPGLAGWEATAAALRGAAPYVAAPIIEPSSVPAQLRRRTSLGTRIAIGAALEAVSRSGRSASDLAAVFASAAGSGTEVSHLLEALAQPDLPVSPTHFHNSVHNSAVGYWCMTTASHRPSTSVACHDDTFAAALLKAAAQVAEERQATILAVFDAPFPQPLHSSRPIGAALAIALVLVPPGSSSVPEMEIDLRWSGEVPTTRLPPEFTRLAQSNPAGRGLPLLLALARRESTAALPYLENGRIGITLWH